MKEQSKEIQDALYILKQKWEANEKQKAKRKAIRTITAVEKLRRECYRSL